MIEVTVPVQNIYKLKNKPAAQAAHAPFPMKLHQLAKSTPSVKWP
jgi:hypothetical protein